MDYLEGFENPDKPCQTGIGRLSSVFLEDGGRNVCLGDKVIYSVGTGQDDGINLRIAVLDNDSMELVDQVGFSFQSRDDVEEDYIAVTNTVR